VFRVARIFFPAGLLFFAAVEVRRASASSVFPSGSDAGVFDPAALSFWFEVILVFLGTVEIEF
jgi:hypothetical protein